MKINDKEVFIDNIVISINSDIQRKDFLTYEEQDIWKDYLNDIIDRIVEQENKQLKDNWNKLKEYINSFHRYTDICVCDLQDFIEELEKGE